MRTDLKLKVCGLSEPQSMRGVVECGPDFAGFIFYPPSPRYVLAHDSVEVISRRLNAMPADIAKVGVFVNEDIATVIDYAQRFGLTYIQLHGDETPAYAERLKAHGLGVIKVFRVTNQLPSTLDDFAHAADYFLFDTDSKYYGGSGKHFDWSILQNYDIDMPFFLSGGIRLEDITDVMSLTLPQLTGIDVNSGFEIAPGVKDCELIRRLTSFLQRI